MRGIFAVMAASILLSACKRPSASQEDGGATAPISSTEESDAASPAQTAAVAETKARSAALDPQRRAQWVRQCALKSDCAEWQRDAIIQGAPEGERLSLMRVQMAASTEAVAKYAKDGTEISTVPARFIESVVARDDLGILDDMPTTTLAEAKKDPQASRGKTLTISGRIIEIRKVDAGFEGAIVTDNRTIVRFASPLSTENLYEDSSAKFRGVFLQEYDYPNVSGGETQSLFLIGAFDIPENRHKPLPIKSPGETPPVAVKPTVAAAAVDTTPAAPLSPALPNACDPPYTRDPATGGRHYKPECVH